MQVQLGHYCVAFQVCFQIVSHVQERQKERHDCKRTLARHQIGRKTWSYHISRQIYIAPSPPQERSKKGLPNKQRFSSSCAINRCVLIFPGSIWFADVAVGQFSQFSVNMQELSRNQAVVMFTCARCCLGLTGRSISMNFWSNSWWLVIIHPKRSCKFGCHLVGIEMTI